MPIQTLAFGVTKSPTDDGWMPSCPCYSKYVELKQSGILTQLIHFFVTHERSVIHERHYHNVPEIIDVSKGILTIKLSNPNSPVQTTEIFVSAGETIIIPPFVTHTIEQSTNCFFSTKNEGDPSCPVQTFKQPQ